MLNAEGEQIGVVTSGSHSPMLRRGSACAVQPQYMKAGTGSMSSYAEEQTITITKMPSSRNYYRGPGA